MHENNDKCVNVMINCARQLYLLPYNEQNIKQAKELLDKVFMKSPENSAAHKIAGDIYYREETPLVIFII